MQDQPLNDKYILCPFQIQMCDQQGGIGLGTAFFYERQGETFVITNWHNITGKHPFTGKPLHPERTPLYIRAKLPVVSEGPDLDNRKWVYLAAQRIEIEDKNGPSWFEHERLGSLCDCVAIPFKRPAAWPLAAHVPANKIAEKNIPIEPGLKVVVIGFPQGMSTGPGLPLTKTGFVSSMPGYDVKLGSEFSDVGGMKGGISLPAMFLDVHTIPGMSGSPVFGEYSGVWNPSDLAASLLADDAIIGTSRQFLGCHSSRLWEHEERSGLGICIQGNEIEEICQTKHKGSRFPKAFGETGFI